MTLDEARAALRTASEDLAAIESFLTTGFDKDGDVTRAFEAAGVLFVQACREYATVVTGAAK